MLVFIVVCVFCLAALPALLFLWNLALYRRPPLPDDRPAVSILIPARNEERSIEACVLAALASRHVQCEVLVLDDGSQDRTADIVRRIAGRDKRLKLLSAAPLPVGWCGKQWACYSLAGAATKPVFCFLDADVVLAPEGVARMIAEMRRRGAGLMSGFPRQITETALEQLLLPLMHFLLLGFLPLAGMHRLRNPSFGAGCGQIFVAERSAYRRAGGHAAIRNSRHDGITLPKAFRRADILTSICDATAVASCRMYRSAGEVFFGLLKNADEGLASPSRILPFSLLLFVGQVLPVVLFAWALLAGRPGRFFWYAAAALFASYLPRFIAALRFRQPRLATLFHPIAILVLLGIQWYALLRSLCRVPATWKGRSYSTT